MYNNPKLAEKLMFGSTDDRIVEINEKLWKKFDGNRFDYYLNIARMCGRPSTSRARYVIAMAYSWNSVIYCQEAIEYLELYLSKPLYRDKCISNGIYTATERKNLHLSDMYCYLGSAYRSNKEYNNALKSYYTALKYCPCTAHPYIEIAKTYSYNKELEKAIRILKKAKMSEYAKYDYEQKKFGELYIRKEAIEKRLEEYQQRLYVETEYPYNQKQIREKVMSELSRKNLKINLTQPKLALICEQFHLKSKKEYFYKYPDSNIYRCSKRLVDVLINSLLNNPNLIEEIKEIKSKTKK